MKNKKIATLSAVTAAFMMIATACSAPATETTAPTTTAAVETTTVAVTTTEEETTVEETTEAPKAGALDDTGKFTAASGKYEITVPKGWELDSESDDMITTFSSGNNYLEITSASEDIGGLVEELPTSLDEYKSQNIREGEQIEVSNYKVTNNKNGKGQTFQYTLTYGSPDEDVEYFQISGFYDLDAKTYISAAVSLEDNSAENRKAATAAIESFNIK